MKKALLWITASALFTFTLAEITDNSHVWKGVRECYLRGYRNAQVDDLRFKTFRTIPASDEPSVWPKHTHYTESIPASILDSTKQFGTVALVIVIRDSLLFDWTSDQIPGADTMRTNGFSMAKTLTALAIGAAVTKGLLAVDDPVSNYLPRFQNEAGKQLTIRHLLQMRSGIHFGESYKNPLGFMAKSTYGTDILKRTAEYAIQSEAGASWMYQGGNTLVLQEILLSVIDVPLGTWFSETVWKPIGAEEDAAWAIDNRGHERNYCCFYSRARDYAKLGQLLLDSGRVGSCQTISRDFMLDLMSPVGKLPDGSSIEHYGYQTWLGNHKGHSFVSMNGLHGQYIVAIHDLDLVVVRTGFSRPKGKRNNLDEDVFYTIDFALSVLGDQKQKQIQK